MGNKKLLLMTLAASTFLLAGCPESETQDTAAQESAVQEQSVQTFAAKDPSSLTGIYCQKAEDKNTRLAVIEDNNNDLRFSVSVWNNASGHDCGIVNGIAKNDGNGKWLYQADEEGSTCSITITAQEGFTLSQSAGDCRAQCGANASIGEVTLPAQTKINAVVTEANLTGFYETPVCP